MTREEENTKAAIDNSGSNLIETLDRDINRREEIRRTLDNEFLYNPGKEFLAHDLRKFLEDYSQVKADIEDYIRHCLKQLSTRLYDREMIQRYRRRVTELKESYRT